MAKAILTAERLRELLHYDPDTGIFTRRVRTSTSTRVGEVAGTVRGTGGYRCVPVDGKRYAEHRLAWFYVYGRWPTEQIDHINGIRIDNRIVNLRDASGSMNRENQRAARSDNRSSGILGVCYCKLHKKWKASIRVKGVLKHIKYCATAEEARDAYIRAKRALHEGCTI